MKELDLLLVEYLQQCWPDASLRERESFAQILELPDPQLAAYLLGNVECPEETLRPLLATLRGLAARRVQRERGPPDGSPTRRR